MRQITEVEKSMIQYIADISGVDSVLITLAQHLDKRGDDDAANELRHAVEEIENLTDLTIINARVEKQNNG